MIGIPVSNKWKRKYLRVAARALLRDMYALVGISITDSNKRWAVAERATGREEAFNIILTMPVSGNEVRGWFNV